MTRFARAKDSKSLNKCLPERAPDRSIMKKQNKRIQQEIKDENGREEIKIVRQQHYDGFVKQQKKTFKEDKEIVNNKLDKSEMNVTPMHKKNKKIKDKQNNLSWEIESIADNNIFINKDVDNDAPVEISAKIAPREIVQKKKKTKKDLKNKQLTESTVEKQEYKKPKRIKKFFCKRAKKPKKINEDANQNKNNKLATNKRKRPNNEIENETPNEIPPKEIELKVAKVCDNKEPKQRRLDIEEIITNELEVDVVRVEGFPVEEKDARRLNILKMEMIKKKIPKSEIQQTLTKERRKAENELLRKKKQVCLQCLKSGHWLSECPKLKTRKTSFKDSAICSKCGSIEHKHFDCKIIRNNDFKYAYCFLCMGQGHISKQCPDNPKRVHPDGRGCKVCGDVTHFKKYCPQSKQEKEENAIYLNSSSKNKLKTVEEIKE